MKELGLDLAQVSTFFMEQHDDPFVLVKVEASRTDEWTKLLGVPARRCYIADERLQAIVDAQGHTHQSIVESKIPPKGSVMAGDYGEIMTALYLASRAHPEEILEPKMWSLKADRTKASQGSDVVQLHLPDWPDASMNDRVTCAEVKTKSTNTKATPIADALADSAKDRESRLAKTLTWIRERALLGDTTTVTVDQLNRFIKVDENPPAKFEFRAVAVISSELVADATSADVFANVELPSNDICTLIVISVPDLKNNYQKLFEQLVGQSDVDVVVP
jgi:hypothetical protein